MQYFYIMLTLTPNLDVDPTNEKTGSDPQEEPDLPLMKNPDQDPTSISESGLTKISESDQISRI